MTAIGSARQLGAAVRAARRRRDWTQVVLAERAGVSRAWLARFETGHPTASLEPVFRVLSALDLDVDLTERRLSAGESEVVAALDRVREER